MKKNKNKVRLLFPRQPKNLGMIPQQKDPLKKNSGPMEENLKWEENLDWEEKKLDIEAEVDKREVKNIESVKKIAE